MVDLLFVKEYELKMHGYISGICIYVSVFQNLIYKRFVSPGVKKVIYYNYFIVF